MYFSPLRAPIMKRRPQWGLSRKPPAPSTPPREPSNKLNCWEANLAKSLMICEVLWELLAEKTGLTEDDLYNKLYEVDMRDGVLDGKNQRGIAECAACGRKVSGRHVACLYCGEVIDSSVFNPG
jgi:hypothetical protein